METVGFYPSTQPGSFLVPTLHGEDFWAGGLRLRAAAPAKPASVRAMVAHTLSQALAIDAARARTPSAASRWMAAARNGWASPSRNARPTTAGTSADGVCHRRRDGDRAGASQNRLTARAECRQTCGDQRPDGLRQGDGGHKHRHPPWIALTGRLRPEGRGCRRATKQRGRRDQREQRPAVRRAGSNPPLAAWRQPPTRFRRLAPAARPSRTR